jgi:hypothetical protein
VSICEIAELRTASLPTVNEVAIPSSQPKAETVVSGRSRMTLK